MFWPIYGLHERFGRDGIELREIDAEHHATAANAVDQLREGAQVLHSYTYDRGRHFCSILRSQIVTLGFQSAIVRVSGGDTLAFAIRH